MGRGPVVLGVGAATGHDSGAALLVEDQLVAACEEERLTRTKHDDRFPGRSIDYCLQTAGLAATDVEHVAVGFVPGASPLRQAGFVANIALSPRIVRKLRFLRGQLLQGLDVVARLRQRFPNAKLHLVQHHLAHAASAFLCSPFDAAAIITMDGRGEWSTGLMGYGQGERITKLGEAYYPESIGMVYSAFTHYLGFEEHDEYKVMGLSAYGEPEHLPTFERIFRFDPRSMYRVDLGWIRHPGYADCPWGGRYYSDEVERAFGPARRADEPLERRHRDVATSLQRRLESVGVEIAAHVRAQSASRRLVIAGGVGLNGLMNHAIKSRAGFDEVFVQPASNDGGIALGAALYANHTILGRPRAFVMRHAYWGPEFDDDAIRREIDACRLPSRRLHDPAAVAAELIADNAIIGWFQGRTELGPRALGNRSILADARRADNRDRVNARIKFREEFRPFAPSVLAERAHEYFEGLGDSPFMLMICGVRPEKRSEIPAVVHVDGTARPQTVGGETNPRYRALLEHFDKLTGVPVVLNTSFNVKGEPIVNTPVEAIRCFFSTGLDYLVLGNHLLWKGELPAGVRELPGVAG